MEIFPCANPKIDAKSRHFALWWRGSLSTARWTRSTSGTVTFNMQHCLVLCTELQFPHRNYVSSCMYHGMYAGVAKAASIVNGPTIFVEVIAPPAARGSSVELFF